MNLIRTYSRLGLLAALGTALLPAQERTYSFSTLAGTASAGQQDGDSETARFNQPMDVAVDQTGNLYVADNGNHAVRKITPAGITSTIAGAAFETRAIDGPLAAAGFRGPNLVEVDALGNLFVGDLVAVRRIGLDGQVTTFAGYPGEGFSSALSVDGTGTDARFNGINGLALAPGGALYVTDGGVNTIRRITQSAVVTTVAGHGGGRSDGQGTAASLLGPSGLHVDAGGIVWIADSGNHTIRRMTPDGTVTTFAGTTGTSGLTDGIGTAALLHTPQGITGDLAGNLYISEFGVQGIRKIKPSGQTTILAGKIGPDITNRQGSDDGEGRQASFRHPRGVATDAAGNVYIADSHNHLIRKMTPAGSVSTVAGYSPEEAAGYRDARGTEARFRTPWDIAVTTAGVAYVADAGNHVIRKIDVDGTVTTFAGKPGEAGYADGTGAEARFDGPHSVAFGPDGNLYVADANNAVRRITPAGTVTTLAGSNQADRKIVNASGPAASFARTGPMAVAADGSVYVTDSYHTSYGALRTALRKVSPSGDVTTEQWEFWPHSNIGGMAFAPDGTLILTDSVYAMVFKFKGGVMETMQLQPQGDGFYPHGIAIDQQGNVFLTEAMQSIGSRIAQMSADGTVRILGGVKYSGWKDGVGAKAVFQQTAGIAVDGRGNLYVACASNVIRKGLLLGAPVITTHPQGATVNAGGSVQLTVVATGEPAPTYQWFRNGVSINGANAASYTVANVSDANTGSYTVNVSNSLGSVISNVAAVSVSAAPAPTNPGTGGGAAGSSGGGGAPSYWFLALLFALGIVRRLRRG